jgi:hypothetical protein
MSGLTGPLAVIALTTALAIVPMVAAAQSQLGSQPSNTTTPTTPATSADVVSGEVLSEIALTRSAIQAQRQAIVTAAMDLTAAESQAFWPLYRDYRTDMGKVDDRLVYLIIVYAGNYDSLSDEMAGRLLTDYMDIERAHVDVKGQYLPRFQSVLPMRKVARFFQVDNKLDKKIQAELAAEIPLTR